jgi:hypothetical protein
VTEYDGVGVVIVPCRRGKFKAQRIGIKDGKVVVLSELTDNRNVMWAHKTAAQDFVLLATDLARGKIEFSHPDQLNLKFE